MNTRLSKYLKIIICVILITTFTIKFHQGQEIENYAYVLAIGFDTSKTNNVKVSFQFAKPVSSGDSGSAESQSSYIYTLDASSLSSAVDLLDSSISKQVNLSHCKVVVFSEEFAKIGISKEIYTLINNVQIRPDVSIIVSKCDSRYFIEQSKPSLESLVTKYYETAPSTTEYTGHTSYIKIGDFFNALTCTSCQPYAILGGVTNNSAQDSNNNESNLEKESNIKAGQTPIIDGMRSESLGLAIFKDDKLVGEASAIDALCHLIITNNLKFGTISIPNPFEENSSIDLSIYKSKNTKNKVQFINNSPYITIDVKINARILSVSGNSKELTNENIEKLEQSINFYLKEKISKYLYKTSLDFNSDVCGFRQKCCYSIFNNT